MRLIVLRPPERASATLRRIEEAGGEGVSLPLFALEPVAWSAPDPARFDALAITSANAVAFAGAALVKVARLPVWSVGEASAVAARAAGLTVVYIGQADAAALFAEMADAAVSSVLWLTGKDRRPVTGRAPHVTAVETYRAAPLPIACAAMATLAGTTVLIHSPRAAHRLAELVVPDARAAIAIVAISAAACEAAGPGWASADAAPAPTDAALVALAIDRARAGPDKRGR